MTGLSTETTVTRAGTPVFVVTPEGEPRGGVVVVQEAFGVNGHIESICRRLAAEGYAAAAPHVFWREGDPTFPYDGAFDKLMPVMGALTADGLRADVDAALAELADRGLGTRRCAIIGFCMGGSVALAIATEQDLGAAVSFYGGGVSNGRFGFPALAELASGLRAPWLGLYGDQDQGIPVDDVEALRAAAAKAPVATEVVRYPEAGHGFHCDERASYHEASARDAWARMLNWLRAHLPAVAA
jgi:carboxymethylenebutenolidase